MGNNLFFGGIIMKKLFSSAISVFTSLALISSSAISYASAAGSVPVDSDLSRETLYLDEADDLTFTAAIKEILAILRKNTFKMVINPFFSLKRKLVMLILFVSPKLYANLLKFQKKKFMKLNY